MLFIKINKINEINKSWEYAEDTGFEPVGQFPDHSLANCSYDRSGNLPCVVLLGLEPRLSRSKI